MIIIKLWYYKNILKNLLYKIVNESIRFKMSPYGIFEKPGPVPGLWV